MKPMLFQVNQLMFLMMNSLTLIRWNNRNNEFLERIYKFSSGQLWLCVLKRTSSLQGTTKGARVAQW